MSDLPSPQENAHARTKAFRLQEEVARLKAEVEHLMVFCNCTLIPNKELQAENARLQAEVERLRKAGDWLPIESAPRDGSYFIGGVWGDMESRPTWATMCHYYVSGKRFEMQETCDQPDFWIPLPNAPKEGKPSV
jgi:uncharacterized small protein (DUF1192 family)